MSDRETKENNKQKIHVSARVRQVLSWEDPLQCIEYENNSIGIKQNVKSLAGEQIINFYPFHQIFDDTKRNEDIFCEQYKPICENTLENGYNSIIIMYGQTGSGKTYTLLGNKYQNTTGILSMCLQYFLNHKTVSKLRISAVEIYGKSIQKINVFDLLDNHNLTNRIWKNKKLINERTANLHSQLTCIPITNQQQTIEFIENAQQASHFAQTGKNAQSSRGHIIFIITIERINKTKTNFLAIDLAGSEGDSSLNKYSNKVSKKILKTRRLEAGIINYGLSELQKILSQLAIENKKKETSDFKGSGIRKVLYPYLNKETYISCLFTLSPSHTNIKSTRCTLRVANMISMIDIIPKQIKTKPTKDEIIDNLNQTIEEQKQFIQTLQNNSNEMEEKTDSIPVTYEINQLDASKSLNETIDSFLESTAEDMNVSMNEKLNIVINDKDNEINELMNKLKNIHDITMEKDKKIEELVMISNDKDTKIKELNDKLKDKENEIKQQNEQKQ
eukprot:526277_1